MDTVADFLTQIRNAGKAKLEKVDMPASKLRAGIANVLVKEGFVRSFKVANDSKQGIMRVYLKYDDVGNHVISQIKKVSTPGRRLYVQSGKIPAVRSGLGVTILTTSKGILSGKEAAEKNVGGELLCTVW